MTITTVSTHENTLGPRHSLDLIKAATVRRKRAVLAVGTLDSSTKGFPSQIRVKLISAQHQTPGAKVLEVKTKVSGAKRSMISDSGSLTEDPSRAISNSAFHTSDTSHCTKSELQRVVLPVAAAQEETGCEETVDKPQLYTHMSSFKTSRVDYAERTYAPRQRSLLGLNETDTRPASSPRAFHPNAHKLKHTLPIEAMHKAEPLRSARHGNWKYHMAMWTLQRRAA